MKNGKKSKYLVLYLFIISFGIVLMASFVTSSMRGYLLYNMELNIEKRLNMTAERLAELVSFKELELYQEEADMELPSYQALRLKLLEFSKEMNILYAYFIRPKGDYMYYIIDNDFDESTREGLDTPPFRIEEEPIIGYALEGRTVFLGLGNYTLGWDGMTTSYAPIFGPDGTVAVIAGVDLIDESILWAQRMIDILTAVQIFAVVVIFVSGLVAFISFRREADLARKANAAKSDFLAAMSHEIRTPMNAVIGLSEIELRGELPESSKTNIIQIHRSGSYLLGIINDILDISKIEAGGIELTPVEYETVSLISDTINLNRVRLGSKPVDLVLQIKGDFPRKLWGDELRVRQILNNLLSNAVKYTEEGEIKLKVKSEKLKKDSDSLLPFTSYLITFTVSDTGIGIREEDMRKLFISYSRLDLSANRKIEGTGLGLVIAKNLVEMMGGSISVESEYGKGSAFTVKVIQGIVNSEPIGEETAERLIDFQYKPVKTGENIVRFQMPDSRVLVVDDLPANLLVARGLLKPYGLQVDTAASGQEAIELVQRQRMAGDKQYDLIFIDHMMPDMDGVEAAKVIRAWENERQKNSEQWELEKSSSEAPIPIVALTANALQGMKEFYQEQGFQDYITKPLNPQILDDTINRLIPGHKKVARNEVPFEPRAQLNITMSMKVQYLDMLNHYRVSFESGKYAEGQTVDSGYFEKFTALLASIDTTDMPIDVQEQAALLMEAGQLGDAEKIREKLPAFCEAMKIAAIQKKINVGQETEEDKRQTNKILGEIMLRLKNAILNGEMETAEAIMGELGGINLEPAWRELYFLLYDVLLAGDTEKALGAISLWERIDKR